MANKPKKQHHIPQMLLKHFREKLYKYIPEEQKIAPTNMGDSACQKHLYTIEANGKKDYRLDNSFSEYENAISPLLDKFNFEYLQQITQEEINTIIEFIAHLMLRTPEMVSTADDYKRSEEYQALKKEFNITNDLDFLNGKGMHFAISLEHSHKKWLNRFTYFDFSFLYASKHASSYFILSDKYCGYDNPLKKDRPADNEPFSLEDMRFYFPIKKNICLVATHHSLRLSPKPHKNQFEICIVTDEKIKEINRIIAKERNIALYATHKKDIKDALA